jgi:hypothetical protein
MENSDTDDENHHQKQQHRKLALRAIKSPARGSSQYPDVVVGNSGVSAAYVSKRSASSSRRSSAPLPQHTSPDNKVSRRSAEKQNSNHKRTVTRSYSDKVRTPQHSRSISHISPDPRPSLDEEDSEQKKIRWETPTTHRYQLAEQPRLLEERFLNVLDSVQSNMVCSQNFNKPMIGTSVWNLLESNRTASQFPAASSNEGTGTNDSNSQGPSSEDENSGDEESILEDGPSVVEISTNPPVFSESITASESLLSTSQDSEDENDRSDGPARRHGVGKKHNRNKSRDVVPADSSQILDDLSGMESERKIVEYDNAPHKMGQEQPIVVNNQDRPPVKIYSTSMPFESSKEKKCIVSMGKLQDIHKARSDAVAARKLYEANKRDHDALRKKLKDSPHIPPIPDISVGESNEVSTMSASEDSYMYQRKSIRNLYGRNSQDRAAVPVGVIPENKGLHVESNAKLLFDDSFQDETRSCIPILLQRKRRGADATTSSSSKSLGLRLLSRSGDANTTSEKENDTESPYIYEYDSGVNTYVAYFETSKNDMRSALQVIEHPNPPLLPFGSNEVVVKIDVRLLCFSAAAATHPNNPNDLCSFLLLGLHHFTV